MSKFSVEAGKAAVNHATDLACKAFEYGKWMYTDAPRWFGFFAGVASVAAVQVVALILR